MRGRAASNERSECQFLCCSKLRPCISRGGARLRRAITAPLSPSPPSGERVGVRGLFSRSDEHGTLPSREPFLVIGDDACHVSRGEESLNLVVGPLRGHAFPVVGRAYSRALIENSEVYHVPRGSSIIQPRVASSHTRVRATPGNHRQKFPPRLPRKRDTFTTFHVAQPRLRGACPP
jgi:hypothetical protein